VLLLDQILKVWVKTNMFYGEEIMVMGDWFRLHFLENEGMAFGARFQDLPLVGQYIKPEVAKVALSVFRIMAVAFLIHLVRSMIAKKSSNLSIYSMAFIMAGALGNIVDSIFYGKLFSESSPYYQNLSEFMPEDGGYAGLFHGRVVDMFYFPIIQDGTWPNWVPKFGGQSFEFFRPVFNLADSSITIGVIMLIISIIFNKEP